MYSMINICSKYFLIVFALSSAVMLYLGAKQYVLLGNGDVRRRFKDRFYEILSLMLTFVNWPLFMLHESNAMKALEDSGVDKALLIVEEERSFGTVAIMTIGFFIIFFCMGKLASLVRLGHFYDWDEPSDDVAKEGENK